MDLKFRIIWGSWLKGLKVKNNHKNSVAPPWAFNSGAMFGKGIYFADMFNKSWGYTEDYSLQFSNGSYY